MTQEKDFVRREDSEVAKDNSPVLVTTEQLCQRRSATSEVVERGVLLGKSSPFSHKRRLLQQEKEGETWTTRTGDRATISRHREEESTLES